MKFSILSSELQKALAKLMGVVPSKSTMPILEHILVEVFRDESGQSALRLTATDLEITISVTVPLGITNGTHEPGKIAVPARRLMDTVRALPEVPLSFSAEPGTNKVIILTETGEYQLTGESSEEYPIPGESGLIFQAGESAVEFSVEGEVLKNLAAKTVFAVSTDELRPAMMGVLLQIRSNELRAVSTDGHRLVLVVRKEFSSNVERDLIVPAKAMNLLLRSIEPAPSTPALAGKGLVIVTAGQTHIKFALDSSIIISRLIEESYPNYESVIPLDNNKQLVVNRFELLAAVRRVALYSSSVTHQIRLQVVSGNEGVSASHFLELSAEDVDFGGGARERIACTYEGEPLEIGFNARYIEDLLTHLDSEEVLFEFSTPTRAAIVKPQASPTKEDILMLVMPIRLNS